MVNSTIRGQLIERCVSIEPIPGFSAAKVYERIVVLIGPLQITMIPDKLSQPDNRAGRADPPEFDFGCK